MTWKKSRKKKGIRKMNEDVWKNGDLGTRSFLKAAETWVKDHANVVVKNL